MVSLYTLESKNVSVEDHFKFYYIPEPVSGFSRMKITAVRQVYGHLH